MAEAPGGEGGGGGHKGKKRAKKASTRIDMTPMVDLAFLLLTFFVMTSTFSKPKVMSLVYPAKPEPNEPISDEAKINNAITFLLSEDKIFYYEGEFHPQGGSKPATVLEETTFGAQGVRKVLTDKNKFVLGKKYLLDEKLKNKQLKVEEYEAELKKAKGAKEALKVLIKTDSKATCKNFIDLVDELKINDIGVVAPVDLMQSELTLMEEKTGK